MRMLLAKVLRVPNRMDLVSLRLTTLFPNPTAAVADTEASLACPLCYTLLPPIGLEGICSG
jgi:hypothetical protein